MPAAGCSQELSGVLPEVGCVVRDTLGQLRGEIPFYEGGVCQVTRKQDMRVLETSKRGN